jgi:hypothetical protein
VFDLLSPGSKDQDEEKKERASRAVGQNGRKKQLIAYLFLGFFSSTPGGHWQELAVNARAQPSTLGPLAFLPGKTQKIRGKKVNSPEMTIYLRP